MALIFAEARQRPGATKPSDLPFTLATGDYAVFAESGEDGAPPLQ